MVPLTLRLREDSLSGQRARPTARLWGDRLVRERRRKTYRTQLKKTIPPPILGTKRAIATRSDPMSKKCFHLALFYHRWFEDAVLHPSRNLGCLRSTIGRVAHLPRGKREEKRLGLGMVYGNHTIKVLSSGELSRKRKTFRSRTKSDMTGPDSTPLPPRARGGAHVPPTGTRSCARAIYFRRCPHTHFWPPVD